MASPVRILIASSSHDPDSRSERLALRCQEVLAEQGVDVGFVSLKDHPFPPYQDYGLETSDAYKTLHPMVDAADGLVLATPVYNWGVSGELKRFIEHIGSTPTDGLLKGALFDKVVTFVCAAGLPHSFMAVGPMALSLMFDFKCIVNPYQIYVHNRHWEAGSLIEEADEKLRGAMNVMVELTTLLKGRTYKSEWSV